MLNTLAETYFNFFVSGRYLRNIVDRNTNSFTCTYGFYTQEDFDKVSKISFDINNRYKVNYDNAVTVDLK